jgi:hypothetical protein
MIHQAETRKNSISGEQIVRTRFGSMTVAFHRLNRSLSRARAAALRQEWAGTSPRYRLGECYESGVQSDLGGRLFHAASAHHRPQKAECQTISGGRVVF